MQIKNRVQFFCVLLLLAGSFSALAQPTLSKTFTPNNMGPGSHSIATLTITNNAGAPVTNLSFTDVLPAAVTIGDPSDLQTDCELELTGSLSAPDGGSTIELIDGEIPAFSSCTITLMVTSSVPGLHTNPAVNLNSSAGSSMSLPVDLTVDADKPGFSMLMTPAAVTVGQRSSVTYTIDNALNANFFVNMNLSDNLPVGMVVADPANASTDCAGGVLTAAPGSGNISFTAAGPLNSGATCQISLDVLSNGIGTLNYVSGELTGSSGFAFGSVGYAVDSLDVSGSALVMVKSFENDPVIPGSAVELLFTIDHLNRNFPATSVAFTDDLSATLAGLTFDALLSNDCGGSVSGLGTGNISFSGGNIAAEGSCAIRASLLVPAGTTPGIYNNTTSPVTAIVDGAPFTGTTASDDLFVDFGPVFTKEFIDDPAIPGGTVTVRYTITNTDPTAPLNGLTFNDDLEAAIPGVTATGLPLTDPCGAGSQMTGSPTMLFFNNGSLAAAGGAGDSCTFDLVLNVAGDVPNGVYPSTTSNLTGSGGDYLPASDDLQVVAAPGLGKVFTDDPVAPGNVVTLEFTLSHSENAATAATNITFTDDLSATLAGLTATLPVTPDPPCGAGSALTGSAGDTFLTLSGATLQPAESCTFAVTLNVPAAATPGSYSNTTSAVSAEVDGLMTSSAPASDDLDVAGLMFSKEFLTDPVIAGETTSLRFTIENIHPTDDATIALFTDNLAGMLPGTAAILPPTIDTCGGTPSGTTFLIYTGGSVSAGTSCVIELGVQIPAGAADGNYLNVTSSLSADQGGPVVINPASDDLTVNSSLLQLGINYTDDPVSAGDPVTLAFTLTNLDATRTISNVAFTDDLGASLSGLVATGLPTAACGGTVAGIPDAGTIDFSGGTLAPSEVCTFTVTLTVPAAASPAIYPNTTSSLTGSAAGLPVIGFAASDELQVINAVQFSKSFDGPTTATRTAVLSFNIDNSAAGSVNTIDLSFTDDLDAVVPGMTAVGLPLNDVCGLGSQISGTALLQFTNGNLPAGSTCTIDVTVQLPVSATAGTFPNITSDLLDSGVVVAPPATADLQVEPAPLFAKVFAPDQVGVGQASILTFSVDNSASALSADNLDFTDNLPAGMVVANPANASISCTGGTLTANPGATVITYTGGSVAAGASCTIQANVTTNTGGVFTNTSGDLTSNSGNSGTASDTLTANAQPLFSKAFTPNPAAINAAVNLTFTIDNTASTVVASNLDFTDVFPAGLLLATPASAATTCTGGTLTAVDGSDTVTYTGGSVAAGASCTVQVNVTAAAAGDYVNLSGDLTSSLGNSGSATDTLTVEQGLTMSKSFNVTGDVLAGGDVEMILIISNTGSFDATNVSFSDDLDAFVSGATATNLPLNDVCGAGSSVTGSSLISLSNGTVIAGGSCQISVMVNIPSNTGTGTYLNVTSSITADVGGNPVDGGAASSGSGALQVRGQLIRVPTLSIWSLIALMLLFMFSVSQWRRSSQR
ncbi:beta strand repeat-containing protein [Marinicella sediminis]|uniref:Beta strand repeat-containing protein n=1 Tax=Marinicella sediminis TaxID=1792834 RepID=A0ABV7JF43_9GAMM|nr:hypothetical protein [Marinicella sediminis]